MNTLHFIDIISHVKKGEKPENDFQAVIRSKSDIYVPEKELRDFFYNKIYDPHKYNRDHIFDFLNYHLSKFKGERIDFVDFLKRETLLIRVQGFGFTGHISNIIPVNEIILEWITKISNGRKNNTLKSFIEYLTINPTKREAFAEGLKKEFRGDAGLSIRAMVEVLRNKGYLLIGERENAAFHRAMESFFDWDIGSYNSIFNPKEFFVNYTMTANSRIDLIYKSLE